MTKIRRLTKPSIGEDVKQLEASYITEGNAQIVQYFGKQLSSFL